MQAFSPASPPAGSIPVAGARRASPRSVLVGAEDPRRRASRADRPRDRERADPDGRIAVVAARDEVAGRRTARAALEYDYALLADSGTAVESGTLTLSHTARPFASMDLVSSTSRRLAVYDIVSNEMRLAIALPGATRPVDLSNAGVYRTTP